MIDVRWADKSRSSYVVQIGVKAVDSQSLFMDIVKTVADCNLSMQAINARKTRDNYELVDLTVEITSREDGGAVLIEISVNEEDTGKVIGRQGRVIKSIRTLARAAASRNDMRVEVEILD